MDAPSTRTLLSSLISQLTCEGGTSIASLPQKSQQLLLSLHCLLPSTLLPALDLLDRRLVTRCIYVAEPSPATGLQQQEHKPQSQTIYYVRSAAPPASINKFTSAPSRYEVRTQTWNCTCASFTFATFGNPTTGGEDEGGDAVEEASIWGGYSLGAAPPACKHLVACVLVEQCGGLFQDFVVEEQVDENTMAGLAVLWD